MRRWPLDRWVAVVGGQGKTHARLSDAKRWADKHRFNPGWDRGKFLNAVIIRVGSSVAHHGRLDGDRYRWTKVK